MELDAPQPAQSLRFIEARLSAVSARLRASRTRPLDREAIEELTELKFSETRLLRRLLLTAHRRDARLDVHLLDPAHHLLTELHDARAEAVRRGAVISLRLRALQRVSRKISFVDSLASLVEDGIDAGAHFLSLETKERSDDVELCLTTDAALHQASFGVCCLRETHSVCFDGTGAGHCRVSIVALRARPKTVDVRERRGSTPWTAGRPSSI